MVEMVKTSKKNYSAKSKKKRKNSHCFLTYWVHIPLVQLCHVNQNVM